MNQSNQYILDLWLIFQKPIRFGHWKVKRKKEKNEFKMQFKILIKPYRGFFSFLANVITLNLHLGISEDLKQETLLNVNGLLPLRRYSFFSQPKIWRHHMYSSSKNVTDSQRGYFCPWMWQTPDQRYFCHTPKYDNIHDLSSGKFLGRHISLCKIKNKVKVKACIWGSPNLKPWTQQTIWQTPNKR